MSAPAAFQATFSDFRVVKGRKVCQWVFETPIEAADAALEALGGIPQPHEERWAAIARIDLKAAGAALVVADDRLQTHQHMVGDLKPLKERRSWNEVPLVTQAAIRCGEPPFWEFINAWNNVSDGVNSKEGAASFVRTFCQVESRSDIRADKPSGGLWETLNRKYEAWQHERNYR